MNLQIHEQNFIVCGASSGLGYAVAKALLEEGANVIAIARRQEKLEDLKNEYSNRVTIAAIDITAPESLQILQKIAKKRIIQGILINAGGPPAKKILETSLEDWDSAYQSLLRWKVALAKSFLPNMIQNGYGRLAFLESMSVKQPIENLVLSTSLRAAVVGFVKTLSQEIASSGVTANVLAPGLHKTQAVERLYIKKSEQTGLNISIVEENAINQIPVKKLGDPADFASMAVWLLSPLSKYVTGQTISIDGGSVHGIFG